MDWPLSKKQKKSPHAWKLESLFSLFKHLYLSCPRKIKRKVLGKDRHVASILKSCERRVARLAIRLETS